MSVAQSSRDFWYLWFIGALLAVAILSVNIIVFILYRKKRNSFFHRNNEDLQLDTFSTDDKNKNETRKSSQIETVSSLSGLTKMSNSTNSTGFSTENLIRQEKPPNSFTLETFRRQSLLEHNTTRARNQLLPLKLSDSLNIYAQSWAEECLRSNAIKSSDPEWRRRCDGSPLGEHIVSFKSKKVFDGRTFTRLIVSDVDHDDDQVCFLNENSKRVGFGCASSKVDSDSRLWVAVGLYSSSD